MRNIAVDHTSCRFCPNWCIILYYNMITHNMCIIILHMIYNNKMCVQTYPPDKEICTSICPKHFLSFWLIAFHYFSSPEVICHFHLNFFNRWYLIRYLKDVYHFSISFGGWRWLSFSRWKFNSQILVTSITVCIIGK